MSCHNFKKICHSDLILFVYAGALSPLYVATADLSHSMQSVHELCMKVFSG